MHGTDTFGCQSGVPNPVFPRLPPLAELLGGLEMHTYIWKDVLFWHCAIYKDGLLERVFCTWIDARFGEVLVKKTLTNLGLDYIQVGRPATCPDA